MNIPTLCDRFPIKCGTNRSVLHIENGKNLNGLQSRKGNMVNQNGINGSAVVTMSSECTIPGKSQRTKQVAIFIDLNQGVLPPMKVNRSCNRGVVGRLNLKISGQDDRDVTELKNDFKHILQQEVFLVEGFGTRGST